jgi:hypothetical protein
MASAEAWLGTAALDAPSAPGIPSDTAAGALGVLGC